MTPTDLIAWRDRLGLSQAMAADAIGVSRRTWQEYEGGERSVSKRKARLFGLAMHAYLCGLKPWPVKER